MVVDTPSERYEILPSMLIYSPKHCSLTRIQPVSEYRRVCWV
nr:MAG TPA: hypothetical protein [Caudoviricetes sp.]